MKGEKSRFESKTTACLCGNEHTADRRRTRDVGHRLRPRALPCEHVTQIRFRIDVIELGGADQRINACGALAPYVSSGK